MCTALHRPSRGVDFTPLFVGCPTIGARTGYVLAGSITVRFADGHEEHNRR
jgi:hypothetical protein